MSDTTAVIEAMLLRYGDTSASGRTVTLQLHKEPRSQHPFEGLKCGAANGQRLEVTFKLINDDETISGAEPVNTAASATQAAQSGKGNLATQSHNQPCSTRRDESPPAGERKWSAAQHAGMLCEQKQFRSFLYTEGYAPTTDIEDAAEAVRAHCGVISRSEIDENPAALDQWRNLAADYDVWRRGLA